MTVRKSYLSKLIVMTCVSAAMYACISESSGSTDGPSRPTSAAPETPVYVSSKKVSTDCGVEEVTTPPPGFAEAPGVELRPMPERVSGFLAIGADRPSVETDWDRVSPGYVLVEPGFIKQSYLINNEKEVVATLAADYRIGFSKILTNGHYLVSSSVRNEVFDAGGYRGCLEEYAADGSLVWRLNLSSENYIYHHDMLKLENGNVLAVVWERVSTEEAISLGRDPEKVAENGNFWYDGVIEVNPYTAEVVWEWSTRHHLVQDVAPGKPNYGVVADHPELLDINAFQLNREGDISDDWTHVNAIDYNPDLDQIVLSSQTLSEIWIIDHSTTPLESAGHSGGRYGKGGDFLYRWGNPARYGRGGPEERTLFRQHNAHWIGRGLPGEGNILIFNNGEGESRPYSTVVEISPQMNADGSYLQEDGKPYGPEKPVWEYDPEPPERFFSHFISGTQRLANGNTLVNQGAGAKLREVTESGEIVWEYQYTSDIEAPHMFFRAMRFAPDHPGIARILAEHQ
jgi:hypothetical protein